VEELAIPNDEKKAELQRAETARDTDTEAMPDDPIGAKSQDLPLEFFARVIWQESGFQSDAHRSHDAPRPARAGHRAIHAGNASERRLLDPFDPVQALPKSAEFLNELRGQFGNLGLAAAAYNAGPRRVQEWLAGTGHMPQETRNYVFAITGTSVDDWATAGKSGNLRTARRRPVAGTDGVAEARAKSLRYRA